MASSDGGGAGEDHARPSIEPTPAELKTELRLCKAAAQAGLKAATAQILALQQELAKALQQGDPHVESQDSQVGC